MRRLEPFDSKFSEQSHGLACETLAAGVCWVELLFRAWLQLPVAALSQYPPGKSRLLAHRATARK